MIMLLMIASTLQLSAVLFEICVHTLGRISPMMRSACAWAAIVTNIAGSIAMLYVLPYLSTFVFVLLNIYRIINMGRVIKRRMHESYLRMATLKSTLGLMIFQLLAFWVWVLWGIYDASGHNIWSALGLLQVAVAATLFVSVIRTMRRTKWPLHDASYADDELPSITVAIPARNETEDLQQCLQSLVASNYPKLEIIVLDDCSQNKRTPEIIRGFAHDGVRFIQGQLPNESWLPKNQAYDRLVQEASGAYIVFCGVDIRFAPDSLRSMMTTMLARNKQMISILPERKQEAYGHFSLIQAMRYWWELVPPRRQLRRPPVISSCWVIGTKALKDAGGFASVKRAIVPEAHFARTLLGQDAYSFLRSTPELGVTSNKRTDEQRRTAIRMRYPQLHRKPGQVALFGLLEATFLLLPFVLAIAGPWLPIGTVAYVSSIVTSILLVATYEISVISTKVNYWWFGLIAQPFAVIADLFLINYSMWRYEFSEVDWKGRNVCVPVMHVTPTLPRLPHN